MPDHQSWHPPACPADCLQLHVGCQAAQQGHQEVHRRPTGAQGQRQQQQQGSGSGSGGSSSSRPRVFAHPLLPTCQWQCRYLQTHQLTGNSECCSRSQRQAVLVIGLKADGRHGNVTAWLPCCARHSHPKLIRAPKMDASHRLSTDGSWHMMSWLALQGCNSRAANNQTRRCAPTSVPATGCRPSVAVPGPGCRSPVAGT